MQITPKNDYAELVISQYDIQDIRDEPDGSMRITLTSSGLLDLKSQLLDQEQPIRIVRDADYNGMSIGQALLKAFLKQKKDK